MIQWLLLLLIPVITVTRHIKTLLSTNIRLHIRPLRPLLRLLMATPQLDQLLLNRLDPLVRLQVLLHQELGHGREAEVVLLPADASGAGLQLRAFAFFEEDLFLVALDGL